MSIQQILGAMPKSEFVEQYYQKLPFAQSQGARELTSLGGWKLLERVLAAAENAAEEEPRGHVAPDLLIARGDHLWNGSQIPTRHEARQLYEDGYTLLVRHAERHDASLRQLAGGFEADFDAPVNIHLYCTPGEQHGFGWHYDAEEVFIVQTQGSKEFELRKNTVNPWPLVETMPDNMRYEQEIMPLMKCLLSPGDWLYIPSGYWHLARARDESVSLAIGLLAPTAIDVFDFLRSQLLSSLLWRQRLPTTGDASPLDGDQLDAEYRGLLDLLAADLEKSLRDDKFRRHFLHRRAPEDRTR